MKTIFSILLIFSVFGLSAQDTLTLEKIIASVLENNFAIKIERNNTQIITNENNIGNAGYLPTIGVLANQNWGSNNTRQEFFSGQVNQAANAKNESKNASLALNWTFFDGFKMFATDKRLQMEEDLAILNLKANMEMKIYQASVIYYTLIQEQSLIIAYEQALQLSRDRLTLTELKVNNGSETQLQLIQAKLDLTADQSNLLQLRKQLNDLKMNLNYLLGRAANELVNVQGVFNESPFLTWENALTIAKEQNSQLLMAKSRIAVSDMQRKEVQSLYFPQLSFFAQYTYGSSQNEVGILNSNRTFGPGIGLTFSWNILDRLSTYTAMKNSTISQENAHLAELEQQLFVETELRKVYTDYEWANEQLQLEQQNILNVTETFSIAKNSFENGALTSLELRNIQYAIVEAESRLLTSQLSLNITKLNLSLTTGNFKGLIVD